MAKHELKFNGMNGDGAIVNTHQVADIIRYESTDHSRWITKTTLGMKLTTPHGRYLLTKHPTLNYYWGTIIGTDGKKYRAKLSFKCKTYLMLRW